MKIDVKKVAKLASLPLNDEETLTLEKQLSEILEYVDQLKQVDTSSVEPTSQTTGLENVTRKDTTSESLSQDEALSNTKSQDKKMFVVKAVFDQ